MVSCYPLSVKEGGRTIAIQPCVQLESGIESHQIGNPGPRIMGAVVEKCDTRQLIAHPLVPDDQFGKKLGERTERRANEIWQFAKGRQQRIAVLWQPDCRREAFLFFDDDDCAAGVLLFLLFAGADDLVGSRRSAVRLGWFPRLGLWQLA